MALPLINTDQIRDAIKVALNGVRSCSSVEIFTEFPQDITAARHGIYISDVSTVSRSPYSLAVNYGGNIYICDDSVDIVFVTFQGDNNMQIVMKLLSDLVFDNNLLDGYHERDYTVSGEYKNRAEYRTFRYILKRMEIQ